MKLAQTWVDLFDAPGLQGRRRRVFGPGRFLSIRPLDGTHAAPTQSLIAGPNAYVRLFSAADPLTTLYWLVPTISLEKFDDSAVRERFDSIEIFDRPPQASETGYAQYVALQQKRTNGN